MADLFLDEGADLRLEAGDLALDGGLASSVIVSLFTDARVEPAESPDGTVRGWWGEEPQDPIGSRLWLHAGARPAEATRTAIERDAEAALQWLVEAGIAQSVDVSARFAGGGVVELGVEITRGSSARWAHLWNEVEDRQVVHAPYSLALTFSEAT